MTKDWIDFAQVDLDVAIELLDNGDRFFPSILYHLQQSVEKALKALLVLQDMKMLKTHDLDLLLTKLEETPLFEPRLISLIQTLEPFSVEVRYPGFDLDITSDDVSSALSSTKEVINIVKGLTKLYE